MNTPSNVFECKNCGHPIPEATDTCGSCGYNPLQSDLKSFREDTKYSSIVGMVIGGVIIVISFVVPELYEGGSIGFLSQGIGWVVLGFNGYAQFKKTRKSSSDA